MSDCSVTPKPMSTAGAVGAGLGKLVRVLISPGSAAQSSQRNASPGNVAPRRPVSMAEAIGAGAGNAVRVLAGGKSRRILGGVRAGGSTFFGNLRHVLGLLFLEVTGSIFLLFAFGIAGKAWSEYQAYHSGKQGPGRFEFTLLLALMFLYFGVSSFWRSRRKAKR